MLESVDKHVSGACAFTGMRVRVPLCARDLCSGVGIGRQACLRGMWPLGRTGSSPVLSTFFKLQYIKNLNLTQKKNGDAECSTSPFRYLQQEKLVL